MQTRKRCFENDIVKHLFVLQINIMDNDILILI